MCSYFRCTHLGFGLKSPSVGQLESKSQWYPLLSQCPWSRYQTYSCMFTTKVIIQVSHNKQSTRYCINCHSPAAVRSLGSVSSSFYYWLNIQEGTSFQTLSALNTKLSLQELKHKFTKWNLECFLHHINPHTHTKIAQKSIYCCMCPQVHTVQGYSRDYAVWH